MPLLNREIYVDPPEERKLENEGVANVNDSSANEQDLEVLRYELKTFVCDGQYEKGMEHILRTYLSNINKSEQPAVWVSGFFGSGKSHLVKMLRALWLDTKFAKDGATARSVANLPDEIQTHLKELTTQGKRHGGLHAASGTLGSSASGSVRLALLSIVFKSVDLPEQYPVARFVMWLKREDIYDDVRKKVEADGDDWQEELDNFYVAEGLHKALVSVREGQFASVPLCVEALGNMFPHVTDVSNDQMLDAIREALSRNDQFPLTLVVLDEVQQFIGNNSDRSIEVQEMIEACCKRIGGKLLVVGTGQTAVTGVANLKKLEGRFTVRVELSDTDVDAVIRQVILAKLPDKMDQIAKVLETNSGEITRQLQSTGIAHRQQDKEFFTADYPILPVRRRFWEQTLRVLDQTGTDSQLRNQLSMAHKVIQTNLDAPLGSVIPGDFLYFDAADRLLQARILPRKVHEETTRWMNGTEDERLTARACGLVFLINKLAASNEEIAIKATSDSVADLMVEDLNVGSGDLRTKLPKLMGKCQLLMRVEDEYRIQTEESAAWTDEFLSQRNQLANETHRIESEREDRMRTRFGQLFKTKSIQQGKCKEPRSLAICTDSKLPGDADRQVIIWIRNGWSTDENSVRVDARQAGNQSPTVFVFIPKRSADDLRHHLMDFKAATSTLSTRQGASSPEGIEAQSAMETTRNSAEKKINELLDDCFQGARVLQGGGSDINGNKLDEMILEAAENSLTRLYPKFHVADTIGWDKVYDKAKKGAPDALKAVGDDGEPAKNPVCKAILGFIAAGKKGSDIRSHFGDPDYGWHKDAVEGGLQVLLVAGLLRAHNEQGGVIEPIALDRKLIGKTFFKVESTVVGTVERIQIRKVLQSAGVRNVTSGEELTAVPEFLSIMKNLCESAGGEPPKPALPDFSTVDGVRLASGNDQLMAIYNSREELKTAITTWQETGKAIEQRWPLWNQLQNLIGRSTGLQSAESIRQQTDAIRDKRMLLSDPDPVTPLLKSLEDTLRSHITAKHTQYKESLQQRVNSLNTDESWGQLSAEQQQSIMDSCDIESAVDLQIATQAELLQELTAHPVTGWDDRIDALSGRFTRAREQASKLLEPETQSIDLPRRTLKDEADVQKWMKEVNEVLLEAVKKGPVVIK